MKSPTTLPAHLTGGGLVSQCAWCHPPGSPGHVMEASHGICDRHADELRARLAAKKAAEK